MVRTQIQLTEEQASELKRIAAERRVSVAQLVREGVEAEIRASQGPSREERRRRALAVRSFRSEVTDLSTRHDEYFVESVLEPTPK